MQYERTDLKQSPNKLKELIFFVRGESVLSFLILICCVIINVRLEARNINGTNSLNNDKLNAYKVTDIVDEVKVNYAKLEGIVAEI